MADPIRQLLSQTSYAADGSTTVWNFSFAGGYLDQDHVKAQTYNTVTGERIQIALVPANFIGPYQLSLTPAVAPGLELTIYRNTPKDLPIVNFADKGNLSEQTLDINAKQAVFIAAETTDSLSTSTSDIGTIIQETANNAELARVAAQQAALDAAAAAASAAQADADAVKKVTLEAAGGAGIVGWITRVIGGIRRTLESKLNDTVNVRDFGAVCDGVSRPLSTMYASLAAAQAVFPSASSLLDELDSVAIQKCFDSVSPGTRVEWRGVARSNKCLYLNTSRVVIDAQGGELSVSGSPKFALVVHGGTLDRTLANPAWSLQLIEIPYEGTTPVRGNKVLGLSVYSTSGARTQTQVMGFFADDCVWDITVKNSDGNGLHLRHCVNPRFTNLEFEDIASYGLFHYQNYGLQGGTLKATRCGQPYSIKQRHKFFATNSARIDRVIGVDCTGIEGTAWCTGGYSFQELVRDGYSPTIIANRNFPGHEICRDVTIGRHDLIVTASAGGSVTTPSVSIGAFADGWRFGEVHLDAGGLDTSIVPMQLGFAGDISAGLAGGATFGQNHRVANVHFANFNSVLGNPLIGYGVSASIIGGSFKNCKVSSIINSAVVGLLPFGEVSFLELRELVGEVTMPLGAVADRGIRIANTTKLYVSGGNRLVITPVNFNAESMCNPVYVQAPMWRCVGRDEIVVLSGGVGASNHTSTYAFMTTSVAGNVKVKATVYASVAGRGLGLASASSTKALTLEACELILSNTPSGEKTGISLAGEVLNLGGHTFTGAWSTTSSDLTFGKNTQNLRRIMWLTAPPTSGTFQQGDIVFNIAPFPGSPVGWSCTVSGTPGTWVAWHNL